MAYDPSNPLPVSLEITLDIPRPRRQRDLRMSAANSNNDTARRGPRVGHLHELGPSRPLPTPPLEPRQRNHSIYPVTLAGPGELIYEDAHMLKGIARKLSIMNSHASGRVTNISTIVSYLEAAKLSLGCIALTYNILANFKLSTPHHKRHDSAGPMMDFSLDGELVKFPRPELVLLAAFRLASSFLDDHPTPISWWTKTVTRSAYREDELSEMTNDMFASVGWKLPIFASPQAIASALSSFPVKGLPTKTVESKAAGKKPVLEMEFPSSTVDVNFLAIPERRKSSSSDAVSPYTVSRRTSGYFAASSALTTAV